MQMSANETHTTNGIMKATAWLQAMGRPILAAKMERELVTPSPNEEQKFMMAPSFS
jgi:hypothetical protein